MKVIYPKNNTIKTVKVPNWLLLNRIAFGLVKLVIRIVAKTPIIHKIKYRHFKPILKKAKEYKDFEIVTVESRHGDVVRILL